MPFGYNTFGHGVAHFGHADYFGHSDYSWLAKMIKSAESRGSSENKVEIAY
jgi:hypothetical protein